MKLKCCPLRNGILLPHKGLCDYASGRAQLRVALRQYVTTLEAQLAHMRERWEAQKPLPYFVEAMFAYSGTLIQAERDWIEQFIKKVEAQHGQG